MSKKKKHHSIHYSRHDSRHYNALPLYLSNICTCVYITSTQIRTTPKINATKYHNRRVRRTAGALQSHCGSASLIGPYKGSEVGKAEEEEEEEAKSCEFDAAKSCKFDVMGAESRCKELEK
mmetsp:Transcript_23461/g.37812  ORF Transcript_23461/g.37812 Transcript_23461/m.37812 type:complete len:121 (-) Transcript_23461:497-859(-)